MRERDENKGRLKADFDAKIAEKSLISLVRMLARHAARCDYEAYIQAHRQPEKDAP